MLNCSLVLLSFTIKQKRWRFNAVGIFLFLFFFSEAHQDCKYERKKKRPYVLEPSPWKDKVLFRFLCVRTLQFAVANRKTNSRSIFRVFRALWPGVSSGQHETRTRCTFFPSYVSFSVDVELRELFNFLEWLKKKFRDGREWHFQRCFFGVSDVGSQF